MIGHPTHRRNLHSRQSANISMNRSMRRRGRGSRSAERCPRAHTRTAIPTFTTPCGRLLTTLPVRRQGHNAVLRLALCLRHAGTATPFAVCSQAALSILTRSFSGIGGFYYVFTDLTLENPRLGTLVSQGPLFSGHEALGLLWLRRSPIMPGDSSAICSSGVATVRSIAIRGRPAVMRS